MKKQEVKNLIFSELTNILAGTGFRLKKSEDAFVRKILGGRQTLGLPLWNYNPEYVFSLNICIRLDAVEAIFHLFSGIEPKYQPMGHTTITPAEYFINGDAKFKVATAEGVITACRQLDQIIRGKIIPFFDGHQDVPALDRGVNRQSPSIDITQPPCGQMVSVILAHLAQNADFERLVTKHRTDMQISSDTDHPFNRLVEYLTRH